MIDATTPSVSAITACACPMPLPLTQPAPSICSHSPVGSRTTLMVRSALIQVTGTVNRCGPPLARSAAWAMRATGSGRSPAITSTRSRTQVGSK